MRILSIAILFLALALVVGCESGPELIEGQPPTYDPFSLFSGDMLPLDSTLGFRFIYADFDNNRVSPVAIRLSFATDRIYPCANYLLEYTVSTSPSSIVVTVYGVRRPEICLTAEEPAEASLELDVPFGGYWVWFRYGDQVDSWSMYLHDGGLSQNRISASFTHFY